MSGMEHANQLDLFSMDWEPQEEKVNVEGVISREELKKPLSEEKEITECETISSPYTYLQTVFFKGQYTMNELKVATFLRKYESTGTLSVIKLDGQVVVVPTKSLSSEENLPFL